MRNSLHFLLLIFTLTLMTSCFHDRIRGKGEVIERDREFSEFNGIALNIKALVRIHDSETPSFHIAAQENLHDEIVTRVDANTLVITSKAEIEDSEPIIIDIGIHKPEMLELNGSGEFQSVNLLQSNRIDIELSGSGKMKLTIQANQVTNMISGSGSIIMDGSSKLFNAQINGSGSVEASAFTCNNSSVTINGSGDVKIHVIEALDVKINGNGNVIYSGDPQLTQEISGSGKVKKN